MDGGGVLIADNYNVYDGNRITTNAYRFDQLLEFVITLKVLLLVQLILDKIVLVMITFYMQIMVIENPIKT